jgi:hypothetical protein
MVISILSGFFLELSYNLLDSQRKLTEFFPEVQDRVCINFRMLSTQKIRTLLHKLTDTRLTR